MDDSLKVLDLTTEGNVSLPADTPVVPNPPTPPTPPTAPLEASAPDPVVVASTNGPKEKKPMGKKTKIVAGILSMLVLLSGLGVGIFLSRQNQLSAIKAGGPNICTWETCQDDPAKWAAGAAAAEGTAQENPAVAAVVNQIVETAVNTSNNSSVGNQIQHIEAVLNTNLSEAEKQALNGVLNPTQQQALSGALAPTTIPAKPSSNTSADNLTIGKDGGWVVKDTVSGQKVDNACNVTLTCKTRADWEAGWLAARQDPKYLAAGIVPKQPEYTDIARDLDNNPSNGIQVGTITNNAGVLEIKDVFTVTSSNTGGCALNDYSCIEKYLQANPGANNSISLSSKVGYIDKTGKIVFTTPSTNTAVLDPKIGLKSDGKASTFTDCPSAWCGGIPGSPWGGFCGNMNGTTAGNTNFGVTAGNTCNDLFLKKYGALMTFGSAGGNPQQYVNKSGTLVDCPIRVESGSRYAYYQTPSDAQNQAEADKCSLYSDFGWSFDKGFIKGPNDIVALYYCPNRTTLDTSGCTCATDQYDSKGNLTCKNIKLTGNITFDLSTAGLQCGIQQVDIDGPSGHASRNLLITTGCSSTPTTFTPNTPNASAPPSGGGNPPPGGSNPTPTPTTTNPSYACYQLQIFRGTTQIQPWQINVGDALIFRGFATASNTTVSRMRFVVSINGVAQAPIDINATLISGQYQADLPYTITQAASYSVTTTPISP